jgi:hypothetical protein
MYPGARIVDYKRYPGITRALITVNFGEVML